MVDLPDTFPGDVAVSVSVTYAGGLAGMVNKDFMQNQRYQHQQTRADRVGAHPDIVEFERCFVRAMAKLGVPVFASEVMRSRDRQDDLYAAGTTKARAGQSPHQYGLAVDIIHSIKGWSLDRKQWQLMGHVGTEVAKMKGIPVGSSIDWGGDWKFYDPAHWQLLAWRSFKEEYPFPALSVPWSRKARDLALKDARDARLL